MLVFDLYKFLTIFALVCIFYDTSLFHSLFSQSLKLISHSQHLVLPRQSTIDGNVPRPRLKSTILGHAWQSSIYQIITDFCQETFIIGRKGGMLY